MSDVSSNQHGKASFELDLGRIGLVVIIPVMLWVFYTTLSGPGGHYEEGAGRQLRSHRRW